MPRPPSKTTDLNVARSALKRGLKTAVNLLEDGDPQVRLRAVHATAQAASALIKLAELGDLEARLETLERALSQYRGAA
ncbi:hypothetical protein [Meiothermus taiwanensis]|uniref:HEAT repeat domain-containing protein n=1 Tax=Meiothermus taiwanensis WR-220 TaxID=1339250 RepID=A0ABM6WF44_9DEIN|nr:hypothetical protein [Meiothermus taiwanensis]AWR85671.1 hypothetical protein Mtai_v1c04230 [Meiothermus taiwanensis WR-220]